MFAHHARWLSWTKRRSFMKWARSVLFTWTWLGTAEGQLAIAQFICFPQLKTYVPRLKFYSSRPKSLDNCGTQDDILAFVVKLSHTQGCCSSQTNHPFEEQYVNLEVMMRNGLLYLAWPWLGSRWIISPRLMPWCLLSSLKIALSYIESSESI